MHPQHIQPRRKSRSIREAYYKVIGLHDYYGANNGCWIIVEPNLIGRSAQLQKLLPNHIVKARSYTSWEIRPK